MLPDVQHCRAISIASSLNESSSASATGNSLIFDFKKIQLEVQTESREKAINLLKISSSNGEIDCSTTSNFVNPIQNSINAVLEAWGYFN